MPTGICPGSIRVSLSPRLAPPETRRWRPAANDWRPAGERLSPRRLAQPRPIRKSLQAQECARSARREHRPARAGCSGCRSPANHRALARRRRSALGPGPLGRARVPTRSAASRRRDFEPRVGQRGHVGQDGLPLLHGLAGHFEECSPACSPGLRSMYRRVPRPDPGSTPASNPTAQGPSKRPGSRRSSSPPAPGLARARIGGKPGLTPWSGAGRGTDGPRRGWPSRRATRQPGAHHRSRCRPCSKLSPTSVLARDQLQM